MMVDAVMFAKLNQKVVLMAKEQEAHRQKRAELARSVEELRRSFNGLKEAIEGIACRLPTPVTPLCSVETEGPSNTTGGETSIPDLARFGTTTMKGVTIVSKHLAHDEISKTGLVERKEVSDLNACRLLDELHKPKNASEDEHNELSRDDDKQIVAKKVTLQNLSDSTMEDDDHMILAKEMVQSKWEGEANVAREPTKFVAHQVFDEMLEPQQGLKQSIVKVFEVNSLHNATFLLLVDSEFLKKHGLLNGLNDGVPCFDPGGRLLTKLNELFIERFQSVKAVLLSLDEQKEEMLLAISSNKEKVDLPDFEVACLKVDELSISKFACIRLGFTFVHLWRRMIEDRFITSAEVSVCDPSFSKPENICKLSQKVVERELQVILASGCSTNFVAVPFLVVPRNCNVVRFNQNSPTLINDLSYGVFPEHCLVSFKLYDPGGGKHFNFFVGTVANMCYCAHIDTVTATSSAIGYIFTQLITLSQVDKIKSKQENDNLVCKVDRLMSSLKGYFQAVSVQMGLYENHLIY